MMRYKNQIINADSRKISELLPQKQMIQTTISSPPYYDMKDYGVEDQVGFGQSYSEYLNDIASVFRQVLDHTKDDGTLWIIVDTFKRNGNVVLLPYDIAERLKGVGWHLQNIIIWKKDKTVPWASGGFVQRKFEYILFFSKNEVYKSYGDRSRISDTSVLKTWWIKYPERYNPKGKALDEVWEFPIPVQGSWGKEYIRHFCPLPKEMVSTMIALSTDEGDFVFDPFSGTGTVPAEAAYMKRLYIGIELNRSYAQQSKHYIKSTINQGRESYSHRSQINVDSFEHTILALRALKYGRVVLNSLEKEYNKKGQLKIEVGEPEVKNTSVYIHYTVFGDIVEADVHEFLSTIVSKAPLSKFGISSSFSFQVDFPQYLNELYSYSRTNSHQFLKGELPFSPKIGLYSKIRVDIDEKDYI